METVQTLRLKSFSPTAISIESHCGKGVTTVRSNFENMNTVREILDTGNNAKDPVEIGGADRRIQKCLSDEAIKKYERTESLRHRQKFKRTVVRKSTLKESGEIFQKFNINLFNECRNKAVLRYKESDSKESIVELGE